IRIFNGRGEMRARAFVTDRVPPGTVWMRDGWEGLNTLTSGEPVLPDAAVDLFEFSSGQAEFDAHVEVEADRKGQDIVSRPFAATHTPRSNSSE
ncbi:MAG TPA: molybdopterin dinucleotide binding domain-containing protein, partial [Myxococcales bacterium]|nr:molybdopterin dinucleotide binding domain-containing protein [Myxococcales bacterium]